MSSVLNGLSVLVVDDEIQICEVLKENFEELGMKVDTAHDGDEAFEKILLKNYDFVISDVRMPRCSGVELLDKVRSYREKTPRIIMMSGFSDLSVTAAKNKGALTLIMKPDIFKDIVSVLESFYD